jgi:hypothetical protein
MVVAVSASAFSVSAVRAAEPAATRLSAEAVLGHMDVAHGDALYDYWYSGLSARLTSEGAPLVGKTIRFSVGDTEICVDDTGETGQAFCDEGAYSENAAAIVAAGGYEASFAGDEAFAPSSDVGPLTDWHVGP